MAISDDSRSRGGPACLVLMFKAPDRSKRRLATQIGPLATAAAAHLFACAWEDANAWPGRVCCAAASAADAEWLCAHMGPQPLVVEQHGANLGERLKHINGALRRDGIERQIFIGIDCPEISAEYLCGRPAVGEPRPSSDRRSMAARYLRIDTVAGS
jgi:glycosyltransferase A (GT-A) superfamily protein (DUF2064 family)